MTTLTSGWLKEPSSRTVTGLLEDAGFQALFVGGCVRNALLGVPVSDLDLSTDAEPQKVMELAKAAGLKVIPTGIDHGTVTVVAGDTPFEITTFRKDIETDGRRAVVAFSRDILDDARRRDFTMNALYCRADGVVVDPLDGLEDLKARCVRFIDDPNDRIREDYLRILRFFRFHAWYGDANAGIDADGLAACAEHAGGLDGLARERVGVEVMKLLAAPNPAPAIGSMAVAGILARVLPGAEASALSVLVHLEEQTGVSTGPIGRLTSMFHGNAKDLLRLSKPDARLYDSLAETAREVCRATELGYRLGETSAMSAVLVRSALTGRMVDVGELEKAKWGARQTFPIQAVDLMDEYSGRALGERLRLLEDLWIQSDFALTKAELLAQP